MTTDLAAEAARMRADYLLWRRAILLMAVFSLTGFGMVMIYSASAVRASRGGGWEMSYLGNQLVWLGIAIAGMVVLARIPYRLWLNTWPFVLLGCYSLLGAVLTTFGTRVNGANRWFRFGSISVQPSELAKIGMILVLAAFFAKYVPDGRPRFFRHVIPLSCVSCLVVVLVAAGPDFGTAALIGCALVSLMLAGGVRIWQLLLLLAPAVPAAAWVGLTKFEYIKHRVESWLIGESFHTNVSKLAIGSGGVWGVGLGQGPAKLDYLPEAHTDFIFAMIGQETGLVGCCALILLYVVVIWQGLSISRNAADRFGSLLAFGITAILGGQAAFNIGVVTGVLPPKGISLPFVSFGGSGLVVYYAMIGLMISITRGVVVPTRILRGPVLKYRPKPAFKRDVPCLERIQ